MTRRLALALPLVLFLTTIAHAAEPKAAIKGPATTPTGTEILIDLAGSTGDGPIFLKYQGPDSLTPTLLYNKAGTPVAGLARLNVPGEHTFFVVTIGTPANSKDQDVAVASLTVTVAMPSPPNPPPQPTPTPGPPPSPVPGPVPASTKLYAIAISSGDTTNPDEVAFASVRSDPKLASTLAAPGLAVDWRAWDVGNPQIDALNLRPYVTAFAKTPCLIIYDARGRMYNADGTIGKGAIAVPTTSAGVVNLFSTLRGGSK